MRAASLLVLLALGAQDEIGALVNELKNGSIEERDAAEEKLLALGIPALPAIRRAAAAADGDTAARLQKVAEILDVRRRLPPEILAEIPGADRNLALGHLKWADLLRTAVTQNDDRDYRWSPETIRFLLVEAAARDVPPDFVDDLLWSFAHLDDPSCWPVAIEFLRRIPEWRSFAAILRAIEGVGLPAEAAPDLTALTDHADPRVREAALRILISTPAPNLVATLRKALADDALRDAAIPELAKLDPASIRDQLPALYEKSPRAVIAVAGRLGHPEILTTAAAQLDSEPAPEKIYTLIQAFTSADPWRGAVAPAIRAALRVRKEDFQWILNSARALLRHTATTDDLKLIQPSLSAPDAETRGRALDLLDSIRGVDAALFAALTADPDERIREKALRCLASADEELFARCVGALVKDSSTAVVATTLQYVIHTPRAAPDAITPALTHSDSVVRAEAIHALFNLHAVSTADSVRPLLKDPELGVRVWAAMALASFRDATDAATAFDLLAKGAPADVCQKYDINVRLLRETIDRLPIAALERLLPDRIASDDPIIAATALDVARFLELRSAVEPARRAVASKDAGVRSQALELLRRLRDRDSAPAFVAALDDEAEDVRLAALYGIMAFRAGSADDILTRLDKLPLAQALQALIVLGRTEPLPGLADRAAKTPMRDDFIFARFTNDKTLLPLATKECALSYLLMMDASTQVDELFAQLGTAGDRGRIAWALSALPRDLLRPRVAKFLSSRKSTERRGALVLIDRMRWCEFAPACAALVGDPLPGVSDFADTVVGRLDDASALGPLTLLLTDSRSRVRALAAARLIDLLPGTGWDLAAPLLADPSAEVRYTVLRCSFQEPPSQRAALAMLGDPSRLVRNLLHRHLATVALLPDLRRIIRDGSEVPRRTALYTLCEINDRAVIPDLEQALATDDAALREEVAVALGRLGAPSAFPLLRTIRTPAALDAIGAIKTAESRDFLIAGLTSPLASVRGWSLDALAAHDIDADDVVLALAAKNGIGAYLRYLQRRRPAKAVPLLLKVFEEREATPEDPNTRSYSEREIPETLVAIGGDAVLDGILDMLKRGPTREMLTTLQRLENPRAAPAIRPLVANPRLRAAAIRALAALDDRESIDLIAAQLGTFDRDDAALALGRLGAVTMAPKIAPLLDDFSDFVAYAAIESLVTLGAAEFYPRILEQARRRDADRVGRLLEPTGWGGARDLFRKLGRVAGSARIGDAATYEECRARQSFWMVNYYRLRERTAAMEKKSIKPPEGLATVADIAPWLSKELGEPVEVDPEIARHLVNAGPRIAGLRNGFEIVVEADRLRFVSSTAAREFWRRWQPTK